MTTSTNFGESVADSTIVGEVLANIDFALGTDSNVLVEGTIGVKSLYVEGDSTKAADAGTTGFDRCWMVADSLVFLSFLERMPLCGVGFSVEEVPKLAGVAVIGDVCKEVASGRGSRIFCSPRTIVLALSDKLIRR